jgi:hypothetical protein
VTDERDRHLVVALHTDQDAPATNGERTAAPRQSAGPEPDLPQRGGRSRHVGHTILAWAIGVALAVVVVAPLALSSGDLVKWASSPVGLGVDEPWPLVVFIALDCAAAVCVGFVVFSAWKGEGAGTFGLLWWLFAGGSAWANYRHGETTPAADDAVFFAAMSLAGPVLLHTTVQRIRRWVRTEAGEYAPRHAHFGLRWLPGVAFDETWAAWRESIRSGISIPAEAILRVRERRYLQALYHTDQIRYALGACQTQDPHALRNWLLTRGIQLKPAELEQALWGGEAQPPPAPRRPSAGQHPTPPPSTARPREGDAAAADLQERVEEAFLAREIARGEVLVGRDLAIEIEGHDRRKRRVQEILKQLRQAPTPAQAGRIAALRAAAAAPPTTSEPAARTPTVAGTERP